MPPAASTTWRAVTRNLRPVGFTPAIQRALHARARFPSCRICVARAPTTICAPASSAAGIVVTSCDCLALSGQPLPHWPVLPQPLTLRGARKVITRLLQPCASRVVVAAGALRSTG